MFRFFAMHPAVSLTATAIMVACIVAVVIATVILYRNTHTQD